MAIKGLQKSQLTKESILEKVNDFQIYSFFMPTKDWELNKVTHSPFSEDISPSFLIGNKYGYISHIAFNDTSKRGDCFAFVEQLYNLTDLNSILEKIDFEMGLGIKGVKRDYEKVVSQYKKPEITKRNTLIQISTRRFTQEEIAYWSQYSISEEELKANNVYSISKLFLNKKKFPLKDTELRFGYLYDGFWKCYRPYNNKKEKWFPNNVPIVKMDGLDKIKDCDTAFINKSKKDHIIISKLFPCSCAVQNEGIACFSEENVNYIKFNSKRQILSFDADITGVKNSQQITKLFGFDYMNVPRKYLEKGAKDWGDVSKEFGLKEVEKILKDKKLI